MAHFNSEVINENISYDDLTKKKLRKMAREKNVPNYSKLRKVELIQAVAPIGLESIQVREDEITPKIQKLAEGSPPPFLRFIGVSKLRPGKVFTVTKVRPRIEGVNNSRYTQIQLYLDGEFETALPSKLVCFFSIKKIYIKKKFTFIERYNDLMCDDCEYESFVNDIQLFRFDGMRKIGKTNYAKAIVSFLLVGNSEWSQMHM